MINVNITQVYKLCTVHCTYCVFATIHLCHRNHTLKLALRCWSTVLYMTVYVVLIENKLKHLWQSRVEIKDYSVAYFDRIAVFEAPYR